MIGVLDNTAAAKTTSHKVVLPFYIYASVAFFAACIFIFVNYTHFTGHYFHPHLLAITHIMTLGWGTMVILGASHQLVPVLIEGKLYSNVLATITFILAAIGIPILIYSFYIFNMGALALTGATLIVLAVLFYLINLAMSISNANSENVHSVFIFTSAIWLFVTVVIGLLLVYNFTHLFLSNNSLHFLSLHAHLGIIGWFLLLVIGVGSRLIPMFLISKYTNPKTLWIIYYLINASLLIYSIFFFSSLTNIMTLLSILILLTALLLFIRFIFIAHKQRIRKKVDKQMQISLVAVIMLIFPVLIATILMGVVLVLKSENTGLVLLYGFMVFFGWITAIILGMTFKTLPFIVWNKIYHNRAALGKTENPRDLFSHLVFNTMGVIYLIGFISFSIGIFLANHLLLLSGSGALVLASFLYNVNVFKLVFHKPIPS